MLYCGNSTLEKEARYLTNNVDGSIYIDTASRSGSPKQRRDRRLRQAQSTVRNANRSMENGAQVKNYMLEKALHPTRRGILDYNAGATDFYNESMDHVRSLFKDRHNLTSDQRKYLIQELKNAEYGRMGSYATSNRINLRDKMRRQIEFDTRKADKARDEAEGIIQNIHNGDLKARLKDSKNKPVRSGFKKWVNTPEVAAALDPEGTAHLQQKLHNDELKGKLRDRAERRAILEHQGKSGPSRFSKWERQVMRPEPGPISLKSVVSAGKPTTSNLDVSKLVPMSTFTLGNINSKYDVNSKIKPYGPASPLESLRKVPDYLINSNELPTPGDKGFIGPKRAPKAIHWDRAALVASPFAAGAGYKAYSMHKARQAARIRDKRIGLGLAAAGVLGGGFGAYSMLNNNKGDNW